METSVASLMDHLNGVETRRRVVMMKRKEAETRLAFATEEAQQLQQQSALNATHEIELKKELDHLLEEQRQIQLQIMSEMDTVRHCEVEESLLIEHVNSELSKAEALATVWEGNMKELHEMQELWEKNGAAGTLMQSITNLEKELTELTSEKSRLELAIKEAMKTKVMQSVGLNVLTPPPMAPASEDALALTQIKEELEIERNEFEEMKAQHTRQVAALEREVADLTSRSLELAQWLEDTVNSRDQVLMNIQLLHSCLQSGVCVSCRASA